MVCTVIAYITDYITESSLNTHTMFDMLRLVWSSKETMISSSEPQELAACRLITKAVNALTAKNGIGQSHGVRTIAWTIQPLH